MQSERYLRPEMLPRYHGQQALLASCKVGLVGVGGIGGLCALLLGAAGIGELRLADGDTVALHNLHRQLLFTNSDVGLPKAERAAAAVQSHCDPELKVTAFSGMIGPGNFAMWAQGLDLVIDASDDAQSRLVVSELCFKAQMPLFSAAVSGYQMLLALFDYAQPDFGAEHGCYRCLTGGVAINTKVGITGPLAAMASSLAAHQVLEWLLGRTEIAGELLSLNLADYRLTRLTLRPDPACPVCAH